MPRHSIYRFNKAIRPALPSIVTSDCGRPVSCCEDARVCIRDKDTRTCHTEAGLQAVAPLFRKAAVLGVNNATIRALNATDVALLCNEK